MPTRNRVNLTVDISADFAKQLDDIVQMSGGAIDRAKAAEIAIGQGLGPLLRKAAFDASQSIAACLRCGGQMHGASAADVTFRGCGVCGGIWLDNDSAQRIMGTLAADAIDLVKRATGATRATADTAAHLPCPLCGKQMELRYFESARVTIDVCQGHGTWYDHGELMSLIDQLVAAKRKQAQNAQVLRSAELEMEIQQIQHLYDSAYNAGYAQGRFWDW